MQPAQRGIIPQYNWDTNLNFVVNGTGSIYQGQGWSIPELAHTWTMGSESSLILSLKDIPEKIFLTMDANAFTGPGLDSQILQIIINNKELSDPIFMDNQIQNITIEVPSGYLISGTNTITFNLPNATSPKSLGISEDDRSLGIAVRTIALTTSR